MKKTEESKKRRTKDDGVNLPWTIEELKAHLGVGFNRTPCEEHLVFEMVEYQGLRRMENGKYGNEYLAHIWLVEFHRAVSTNYRKPLPGILEIEQYRWDRGSCGLKPDDLVGLCEISAEKDRKIKLLKIDGDETTNSRA